MIKFLDTFRHRLTLLRHGDGALVKRLEDTQAELRRVKASHVRTAARLADAINGLQNIARHADYALRNTTSDMFLPAVRDYAKELVFNSSNRVVYQDMDGVSAKARWGYDFEELPGYLTPQAPKRVTY